MTLIYVYDALCGWCYGFSPTMERFAEKYKSELAFEVVSGGMVTGGRVGPIGEVAGYISWAYKDVEKATGTLFGAGFLEHTLQDGKAIFTSVPPAVALSVFKSLKPAEGFAFAGRLQRAIYYDGMEPEDLAGYGALAAEFGLDAAEFRAKMAEEASREAAQEDFARSAALGVTGFPTIFLAFQGRILPLARGAVSFEALERQYLQAKSALVVGQK